MSKIEEDKGKVEEEIEKRELNLSNLIKYVDFSVEVSSLLRETWDASDFEDKQVLQKTFFPEKIIYDKEKHTYRTLKVNKILELMSSFPMDTVVKKKDESMKILIRPA